MAVKYRVDVENYDGVVVASFVNFTSLRFTIEISGVGDYDFYISGLDPRIPEIKEDYLFRVWMKDEQVGIPWLNIFTGIHKTNVDSLASSARVTFSSYGPSLEDLLTASTVFYYADTPQAQKIGFGSTIMYELINENIGGGATVANGRWFDHDLPVFLGPDSALGFWAGQVSGRNVRDVLDEIRDFNRRNNVLIDYKIDYLGDYQFRFRAGLIGTDRRAPAIAPTGKNAAGNSPVVLSARYGNIESSTRSKSRYREINTVAALGNGSGSSRLIGKAQDSVRATISPIAIREKIANGSLLGDATSLDILASAKVEEGKPDDKFEIVPRKGNLILFRDYFPGDLITAEDWRTGDRFNKLVRAVTISVNASQDGEPIENIDIKLEDID